MVAEADASNDDDDDDDESIVSVVHNADQLLVNDVADGNEQLIKAQHNDPTLASCWDMAKVNKGNYVGTTAYYFTMTRLKVKTFVSCVCLSVNVMLYLSWPMILCLEVILPSERLVNTFVCRSTGQS